MFHPVIINSRGKPDKNHNNLCSFKKSLTKMTRLIGSWDLKTTTLFMNESDYNDIIKFSSNT